MEYKENSMQRLVCHEVLQCVRMFFFSPSLLNALIPRIDEYVNSPHKFNTMSGKQVMRMMIIISLRICP